MQTKKNLAKPLKIIIINTLYTPNLVGGAEKSVQILAEELQQFNHKVVVVSLSNLSKNKSEIINNVKIHYLANKNIYWPFQKSPISKFKKPFWHIIDTYFSLYNHEIEKILKEELPDIVHTNNLSGFSTSLLKQIKSKGYPIIHTARDYYLLCYKNTLFNNNKICETPCISCSVLSQWKIKQVNAYVDKFIGISDYITTRHLNLGLSKDISTERIYNAVQGATFEINRVNRKDTVFGYLGSISQAKGLNILFDIFCSVEFEKLNWKLKIAGEGPDDFIKHLKSKCNNENIEFLGFVDASQFYKNLDALIVPSQWEEPFGRVVIEAVQMGLTVFVSNKGGLIELEKLLPPVKKITKNSLLDFIKEKSKPTSKTIKNDLNQFKSEVITKKYIDAYYRTIS